VLQQVINHNRFDNIECRRLDWHQLPDNLHPDVLLLSDINYDPVEFETPLLCAHPFLTKRDPHYSQHSTAINSQIFHQPVHALVHTAGKPASRSNQRQYLCAGAIFRCKSLTGSSNIVMRGSTSSDQAVRVMTFTAPITHLSYR
jgi:hypothetical protein